MNEKATPETIAAAQRAVAQQTEATVRDLENKRPVNQQHRAADLERAFRDVENRPLLSGTLTIREKTGVDGQDEKRLVTLATDDGTMLEVFTSDARLTEAADGTQFNFELRAVEQPKVDAAKSGGSAAPQIPAGHLQGTRVPAAPGAAVKNTGLTAAAQSNPQPARTPGEIAEVRQSGLNSEKDVSVDPTTGTTGPEGTNDVTQRSNRAPGGPVNPDDPNATGPSTNAGQATKGEIVEGQQTGGTSGAGTGKGESERAAAREAGNAETAKTK